MSTPSKREYDDWLAAFLAYSSYTEVPAKWLWWSGVSAIAGALQRNVWIEQGLFQIYPNFYIVLNGPAGKVKKSTAINIALARLRDVGYINFAPDATTWEGLIQLMEDLHKTDQVVSLDLDLSTPFTRTIPITVAAPEFSVFIDFEDHAKVSALTHLWDCPPAFRKHTKHSGDEWLEKPCINMVAGTTPSWIKQSFNQWTREGGFASRCIWLHESQKSKAVPWVVDVLPEDYRRTEERLTIDLSYITRLSGPFHITKEAKSFEAERYLAHHRDMIKTLEIKLGGFQDRKQVHILKTAMIISASRGDSLEITLPDMQQAALRVDEAEADMIRSFAIVDERMDLRAYREIRASLEAAGVLRQDSLFSKYGGKFAFYEISQAIDVLKNQEDVAVSTLNGKITLTLKREEQ